MFSLKKIDINSNIAYGYYIEMPKTLVLAIVADKGYLMCGVLDIKNLDMKLPEKKIIAARVTKVKSWENMLEAKVELATKEAKKLGIVEGKTTGREALEKMF